MTIRMLKPYKGWEIEKRYNQTSNGHTLKTTLHYVAILENNPYIKLHGTSLQELKKAIEVHGSCKKIRLKDYMGLTIIKISSYKYGVSLTFYQAWKDNHDFVMQSDSLPDLKKKIRHLMEGGKTNEE